tara:strand:+ start:140 stop:394 length:255 start_codon:yes stop_codon:yes gene_type:complete
MEKKISKTLKRIQTENPDIKTSEDIFKKLSPSEIKILKNLKDKYDLSFFNIDREKQITLEKDLDISEDVKKTLKRINEGEEFKI